MTHDARPPVPYPPSAINRLFVRVEALPGGGWWVYPMMVIALIAYHQAALWFTDGIPVGSLSLAGVPGIVYGPYGLALMHSVLRASGGAMDAFRPASGLTHAEFARRRYELITLPSGRVGIPLAIGVFVAIGSMLSAPPEGLAAYGATRASAILVLGPAAIFGYGITAVGVYASIRTLALIRRLHTDATAVDLFDTAPIYAFSRVTFIVGVGYVFAAYYTFAFNKDFQVGNAFGLAAVASVVVLGVACFAVPLWSIHGRLAAEKAVLVHGVSQRAKVLQEALYRRVDEGNVSGIKDLTDAASGIQAASDRIARLPTWPWPPQVLRGFISALLLPVVVFLITRVVGSQIR